VAAASGAPNRGAAPPLLARRTTSGYGAPTKSNSEKSHGSPLGAEEISGARAKLGWTEPAFQIPADVRDLWRAAGLRARDARAAWEQRVAALAPDARADFMRRMQGAPPPRAPPPPPPT